MIILTDLIQGTDEWKKEKLGKPSASRFSEIITTTGKSSDQREGYMYELAAEQISGLSVEKFKSSAMQEGTDREPESRALYSLIYGVEVEEVGCIYRDELKQVLCSPDGLVKRKWGLEMKNVLPKSQVKWLLAGTLPATHFQQVQGSLYITGYDRWDFLSYSPGLPPLILQIHRDESYISKMEKALYEFCGELTRTVEKLRAIR